MAHSSNRKEGKVVDPFTQAVWGVISGSVELLEELHAIMRQEHKPFLSPEQAFVANTNIMKQQILEKFTRWLEWLPTLPIDQLGLALAEEAIECVDWQEIAEHLQEQSATVS
jgi:hypothetical protein